MTYSCWVDTLFSFDTDDFHTTGKEIHVVTFSTAGCGTIVSDIFWCTELVIVLFKFHIATLKCRKNKRLMAQKQKVASQTYSHSNMCYMDGVLVEKPWNFLINLFRKIHTCKQTNKQCFEKPVSSKNFMHVKIHK